MNNHLPTISICPIGGEQYVEFEDRTKRGHPIRVQYDYRHTDGILYSTIADDLEAARARRDAWLEGRPTRREPDLPKAEPFDTMDAWERDMRPGTPVEDSASG